MLEILTWAPIAIIPLFLLLDLVYSARRYKRPRFWRLYSLVVTLLAVAASFGVGMFWTAVLPEFSLFNLGWMGAWGAIIGVLVHQTAHYWYHRTAHAWNPLWRAAHQMHHSPESLDAFGAYYLSPLDVFNFTSVGILVSFPLLGLDPMAGALVALFGGFSALFQHANIRTPRWVGYFIQRPEAHSLHHNQHRYNYADLPLIDMLFGTWRNPALHAESVGFYQGASKRIPEMLVGIDVSTRREPETKRQTRPIAA